MPIEARRRARAISDLIGIRSQAYGAIPAERRTGCLPGPLCPRAAIAAPSVVAGSPGTNVPGYTLLNTFGNCVPGKPFAMSASPDSGPNENMNVWVPSAMVE